MIRVILVNLLLLLVPTMVYFTYVYFRRRSSPNDAIVADAPIFWLLAAGALLVMVALTFLAQWESIAPGGTYVPPHVEDGRVVPGHIE